MSSIIIAGMFGASLVITVLLCLFTKGGVIIGSFKSILKNFFHWCVSKWIIFGSMIWVFILICLPILILMWLWVLMSDVTISDIWGYFFWGNVGEANFLALYGNWIHFLHGIELFAFLLTWFLFIYSRVLLHRLHISYIKGKHLKYLKNYYFDIKRMILVAKYSLTTLVFALIPLFFLALLLWGILFFLNNDVNIVLWSVALQISLFVVFVIIFLMSWYILYRLYFGLILIANQKKITKKDTLVSYIKESYACTKWCKKLFTVLISLILFTVIIALPTSYVTQYLKNSIEDSKNYIVYSGLSDEQKESVLWSQELGYYYHALNVYYGDQWTDEVKRYFHILYFILLFVQIVSFFVIMWLFEMLMLSLYTHILKK